MLRAGGSPMDSAGVSPTGNKIARSRAPGKVAYGAVEQEVSMIQERDVLADLLDLDEQVGGHENRAALAFQRLDYIADFGHASRVQARCGLVEDEEFRLVEERLRDCDALFHPLRELLDSVVRPVVQLDLLQDGLAAVFDFLGRHAAEAARVRERFQRGEVAVEL